MSWNSVLVLGGIRSGKSAFAEALVADAPSVRYVATAAGGQDDPEWLARIEAHQRRRPQAWSTEETGTDPARLTALLAEAKPDDTLLIDDLGGWVAALLDPARQPNDDVATVTNLADAVRGCAGRVVLVSPEVGLSLVPQTPLGRAFADAVGTANQALADACDRVALVVAGRPAWLKTAPDQPGIVTDVQAAESAVPEPAPAAASAALASPAADTAAASPAGSASPTAGVSSAGPAPASVSVAGGASTASPAPASVSLAGGASTASPAPASVSLAGGASTASPAPAGGASAASPAPASVSMASTGEPLTVVGADRPEIVDVAGGGSAADVPEIEPGLDLPLPDSDAGPDARDRLERVDLPGAGIGALLEAVEFAAATQGTATPRPWGPVRVLLLDGRHAGGAASGADPAESDRRATQAEAGEGALARLAANAGADLAVVRVSASGAMEDGPVLAAEAVDAALRQGWSLAAQAAADGREALVLASCGTGTDAAATAVLAATTGAEPVAVLPRVLVPGARYDDDAWMRRCAAVRDAMHRIRQEPRGAKDLLAQLGGADLAVATGALLGAAAHRLPVLVDGPVGIAAGLIARDLGPQSRHWCLLADAGKLPLVRQGADVLGLTPVLELGLDLGEGANALAALPLLRTAIALAAALPVHPALLAAPDIADFDTDAALSPDASDAATSDAGPSAAADGDGDGELGTDAEGGSFAEPETAGPGPARAPNPPAPPVPPAPPARDASA